MNTSKQAQKQAFIDMKEAHLPKLSSKKVISELPQSISFGKIPKINPHPPIVVW